MNKMILPIVQYPNEALTTPCTEITKITPKIRQLGQQMLATMVRNSGVGLAANQVGESIRMITMWVGENVLIMINPVITVTHDPQCGIEEGCLSIKNKKVVKERFARVSVQYRDMNFTLKKIDLSGLAAICAQHEIEHLDGITMLDNNPKRITTL